MLNWPQAWPWRTAYKHFAWLDYLIPLTNMYTRRGEQRPLVETRYLKPSQAEMLISFLHWATRELETEIPVENRGDVYESGRPVALGDLELIAFQLPD